MMSAVEEDGRAAEGSEDDESVEAAMQYLSSGHSDSSGEEEEGQELPQQHNTAQRQTQGGHHAMHGRRGAQQNERIRAAAWARYEEREFVEATDSDYRANDVDMQGIPWRAIGANRTTKRATRRQEILNRQIHRGLLHSSANGPLAEEIRQHPVYDADFFKFVRSAVKEKPSFFHFQLRHLLSVPSKQDVYYVSSMSIRHYCPVRRKSRIVINLENSHSEEGAPLPLRVFTPVTLAAHGDVIAVGGMSGDLVCYDVRNDTPLYSGMLLYQNICNAIAFAENVSGELCMFIAGNDSSVTVMNVPTMGQRHKFPLPWPVNNARLSPGRRMLCAVGDAVTGLILDARTGQEALELMGCSDLLFGCDWSPDELFVAVGVQDGTCRVYDIRNTSESVAVLGGACGPVRSVQFSPDGQLLAMAEEDDFVHLYGVGSGTFATHQTIDMFSNITGVAFSPDSESLFIGNSDDYVGCLAEFGRIEGVSWSQLDALLF